MEESGGTKAIGGRVVDLCALQIVDWNNGKAGECLPWRTGLQLLVCAYTLAVIGDNESEILKLLGMPQKGKTT
jgi:hypothetical protein